MAKSLPRVGLLPRLSACLWGLNDSGCKAGKLGSAAELQLGPHGAGLCRHNRQSVVEPPRDRGLALSLPKEYQ